MTIELAPVLLLAVLGVVGLYAMSVVLIALLRTVQAVTRMATNAAQDGIAVMSEAMTAATLSAAAWLGAKIRNAVRAGWEKSTSPLWEWLETRRNVRELKEAHRSNPEQMSFEDFLHDARAERLSSEMAILGLTKGFTREEMERQYQALQPASEHSPWLKNITADARRKIMKEWGWR